MKDIILSKINISFADKHVLKDYDITFPAGSKTAIMGPSGCGKTTLLKYILGIIKADSGSSDGIPEKKAAVFQEDRLCEDYTALKNVSLVCRQEEAHRCLLSLGLTEEEINTPVMNLSGGQKRRVSIARALVAESELITMDEPFKGLDEENRKTVISVVCDYIKEKTLIIVTHDAVEAKLLGAKIRRDTL